jgi:DNA replication and repair protein RecF
VYLRRLTLANFRCYRALDLTLPDGPVVVVGGNAQGKSSLLEAMYVLATTRSPYATSDRDLVSWAAAEEVLPFSRVSGEVERAGGHETIEVVTVRQQGEHGEERYAKQVRLNGVTKRALDVLGHLLVVLFTPRDLEIVHGAPTERRRYLDVLLCQVDIAYCRALARYNRVLAQRNHLLRRLREKGGDRSELDFWNQRLVEDGAIVVATREVAVRRLGELANGLHAELVGADQALELAYRSQLAAGAGDSPEDLTASWAAERFAAALALRREEEVARGMTLVGPHRDDLAFRVDGVDMRTFGSRGQQRTVTQALKLAEAQLMRAETGQAPVLLLDDVLSELDGRRQAQLLDRVAADQQTIITTTEPEPPALERLAGALRLRAGDGTVLPL